MAERDVDHSRRSRWWIVAWLAGALAVLLVAAGVVSWRLGWAEDWIDAIRGDDATTPPDPAAVAPPPGLDLPPVREPKPVAPRAASTPLDEAAIEQAMASYLADDDLGRHVLAAVAPLTGKGLTYESVSSGSDLATPASTTKVVTAAVALFLLGADHTFETTTVLERGGGTPTLTLVGGGDPFLVAVPEPAATEATFDPERADLRTLARRTATALQKDGVGQVQLAYDHSLFSGPTASPAWEADYVPDGVVSPITALWVDEGRSPTGFGRVGDPPLAAAQAFVTALTDAGITVVGEPSTTIAGSSAEKVAAVDSAPLAQIVQRIIEVSDNEATEVLLRHVGLADQGAGSFEGGQAGVRRVLEANGIDLRGTVLHDGSGLSRENLMSPATLVDVLRWAARPDQPDLRPVLASLPVAGYTGSLTDRMALGPAEGLGRVRAKTGTLSGVRSLAGIAVDLDGSPLVFVLMADEIKNDEDELAEISLDNAASALGACHCSR